MFWEALDGLNIQNNFSHGKESSKRTFLVGAIRFYP